jgi:hypothetical protein
VNRLSLRAHLWAACGALVVAVWLSSGTMAPYAATWPGSIVTTPCHYLQNVDHAQFQATFAMLDGQPRAEWEWSVVLRRILFPLVAYPFMKLGGFDLGGFFASLLVQLAGLIVFARWMARRFSERAGVVAAWLIATWPGVTYWAALPYSYVAIVPASLALFALLCDLEEAPPRALARRALAAGVLLTAYDLWPFFVPAAAWRLLRARRVRAGAAALALLAAPSLLVLAVMTALHASTRNQSMYAHVLAAYLHPGSLSAWARAVAEAPSSLLACFFYGGLLFLPALFVVVATTTRAPLLPFERALLGAGALVFAFNHLAPPYEGWQLRGAWIARLYQPLFVVFLAYAARVVASRPPAWRGIVVRVALVLALVADASVVLGPVARLPWADFVYQRFYQQAPPGTMNENLRRWGRRPLGFCR